MNKPCSIWIGYDSREFAAFAVARHSIAARMTAPIPIRALLLDQLVERRLYTRPTEVKHDSEGNRLLVDVLSKRPDYHGIMSTEFANSRFLVPFLAPRGGWALFVDSDILCRDNIVRLFEACDPSKALMCVKHGYITTHMTKMDGQPNVSYSRKNWSSVMAFNLDHPANRSLTLDAVNTLPGKDLHRFCWLDDTEIGALDPAWNWLAGEQPPMTHPKIVHHTLGSPCLRGHEDAPYAAEWRAERDEFLNGLGIGADVPRNA